MSVRDATPEAWPPNVSVFTTTRGGGYSEGVYASLNLGMHVADDTARVLQNRSLLSETLPGAARVSWMNQVHGAEVFEVVGNQAPPSADAQWTRSAGVACAVMTADCLPVLITDAAGTFVAAVHVGWRGLAAGVLQSSLRAFPADPGDLLIWTGPAIGPVAFEVGPEVLEEISHALGGGTDACFRPSPRTPGRYLADLRGLATQELLRRGVKDITGDHACTYSDPARYFSHRRDGTCGRLAHLILRKDPESQLHRSR